MATDVAVAHEPAGVPQLSPEADGVFAAPNRAFDDPRGWGRVGRYVLLIVVSVTLDTVSQVQGHLIAHQYEGLIKKSKLRGGKRGR